MLWEEGGRFPVSSVRALVAAKAVQAQGETLFLRYHFVLFRALFEENRDISHPEVLLELAEEIGADRERLCQDLTSGRYQQIPWAEHDHAVKQFHIHSVPTVVFEGRELVVGAVPREVYREVIEKLLPEPKKPISP